MDKSKWVSLMYQVCLLTVSDFGSIFNELLPGSTAKLNPPEGQTIADGLEVKVCLGGVWKESLTELSGGQR
jgi:structural maintenance of chromosome 2